MIFLLKERLQDIEKRIRRASSFGFLSIHTAISLFPRMQLMKSVMARMLLGTDQAERVPSVLDPPSFSVCLLSFPPVSRGRDSQFCPHIQCCTADLPPPLDYPLFPWFFFWFSWETFLFPRSTVKLWSVVYTGRPSRILKTNKQTNKHTHTHNPRPEFRYFFLLIPFTWALRIFCILVVRILTTLVAIILSFGKINPFWGEQLIKHRVLELAHR